jgi:hypothetical protein
MKGNKIKNGGVTVTQTDVFTILLKTCCDPDRLLSGDVRCIQMMANFCETVMLLQI